MPPREQPIGQPSVYRGIYRVPAVFSFVAKPVDADDPEEVRLCDAFNRSKDEFNQYNEQRIFALLEKERRARLLAFKKTYKRLYKKKNIGLLKVLLRDLLVRTFYCNYINDLNNVPEAVNLFNRIYKKLSNHLDTEIVWYWFVVQLKFHREYVDRAEAVAHFRLMLENIKYIRSQPHRDGLYIFFHQRLEVIDRYPDVKLYRAFQEAFPEKPIPIEGWCAIKRHGFLSRDRKNPKFFQIEPGGYLWNVDALERKESREELILDETVCVVSKSLSIKVAVSRYALAMFSAHIVPPSQPKLLLEAPDLDKEILVVVNSRAIKNLRAHKLSDSDGSINKKAFERANWPVYRSA